MTDYWPLARVTGFLNFSKIFRWQLYNLAKLSIFCIFVSKSIFPKDLLDLDSFVFIYFTLHLWNQIQNNGSPNCTASHIRKEHESQATHNHFHNGIAATRKPDENPNVNNMNKNNLDGHLLRCNISPTLSMSFSLPWYSLDKEQTTTNIAAITILPNPINPVCYVMKFVLVRFLFLTISFDKTPFSEAMSF